MEETKDKTSPIIPFAILMLRPMAWVSFIACLICAIVVWKYLGYVPMPDNPYLTEPSPVGIALGSLILFGGISAGVLFSALATIADTQRKTRDELRDFREEVE